GVAEAAVGRPGGGGGPREAPPAETAVPRILAAHALDGQERHPRGGSRGLRGLPGSGERPVYVAAVETRKRLGELLGPLAAVAPGDHRQDQHVGAAGNRGTRIGRQEG